MLALSYFRVFEPYELQAYDWRCQMRGPRPISSDIVLIDIWNDSLERIGRWPFDRKYHAALIEALNQCGAKAVLFDIIFAEPSRNEVLMGNGVRINEDILVARYTRLAKNVYFSTTFNDPVFVKDSFVSEGYLDNVLDSYSKAAKGVGYVNVVADLDGKRRRIFPYLSFNNKNHFHLGVLAALDALGLDKDKVRVEPGHQLKLADDFKIPLDENGCLLVNYAGKWAESFKHYSYADILAASQQVQNHEKPVIDLEELKGKICFIGQTSRGSTDSNATPLEPVYPMVGLHANVANSILKKDFIRRLDRLPNLLILAFLVFFVFLVSLRRKPLFAFRVTFLTLIFYVTIVLCCFEQWGIWIDLVYPFLLTIVVFAVSVLGRVIYEIRKRELLENELKVASQIQQSFLPPSLPQQKGLSLALYMKPAKAVGGDLYTFISLKDEKLGVMVGDVSGKGTPAALFMAKVVSEFKFSARDKTDPAQVLTSLNDSIAAESTGGLFVTLSYVIFDLNNRRLFLSNGGHLPMVVVRASGASELLNAEGGMPVGVMEGASFSDLEYAVKPGDCFALYSDGVSEARNRKKEEYSIETLQKMITDNRHLDAQSILDKTVFSLNQFMGKADQHDDITLIVAKVEESLS